MSQFALQMRQISKTYGSVRANDSINLNVRAGTIHGLAGENGAGKSTLMKILFGLVELDTTADASAGIFFDGNKVKFRSPLDAIKSGVGMVQQHFALAGALSALDNIILGAEPSRAGTVDRSAAMKRLSEIAGEHLRVPWTAEVDELSVGLQQRIEILKLLFRDARLLILDEPTAVLTPQETETFFSLLRKMRADGKTIIIITHKLHEVLSLCDEVTVLRQGKVTGSFPTKDLTRDQLVRAMIGRDIKPAKKSAPKPGEELVSLENVSVSRSRYGALSKLNFKIHRNEVVGIAGVEGNGQGALVEALLALNDFEGNITFKKRSLPRSTKEIREKLNFGLISEDRHQQSLWLDASVADNCGIGFVKNFRKFGFINESSLERHASEALAPYQVAMQSVKQPVRSLSGGNQQKVVVAREISVRKPELLIASQPTRGVDVGAIEFIHERILDIRDKGAGILLVSSELEELCALSDRIIVLFEGSIAAQFEGPDFDVKKIGLAMTGGNA